MIVLGFAKTPSRPKFPNAKSVCILKPTAFVRFSASADYAPKTVRLSSLSTPKKATSDRAT